MPAKKDVTEKAMTVNYLNPLLKFDKKKRK